MFLSNLQKTIYKMYFLIIILTLFAFAKCDQCSGNTCFKSFDTKDIVTWDATHTISTINWLILTQHNKSEVKFSYRNTSDNYNLVYITDNDINATSIVQQPESDVEEGILIFPIRETLLFLNLIEFKLDKFDMISKRSIAINIC